MSNVVLRGPFLSMSGYGTHGRQIAKWLLSKQNTHVNLNVLPWGNTPWHIDADACDGLIGKLMKASTPPTSRPNVSLQLQLPNEFDPSIADFNVGITAGVETDRCNGAWVTACNKMQMLIVPSNHVASSLRASGNLTVPLHVIKECYNEAIDDTDTVKFTEALSKLPTFSTDFNFLVYGQITGNNQFNDRKNIYNTIKWLCETFANEPSVGIVLKLNAGRDTKIDRDGVISLVKKVTQECRKTAHPRIHVLHGRLSDAENAALLRHPQIKAMVSLTRGEGFGLPQLDAAASGLPIIATNWSGHLDFLNLGKFIPVSYALKEVHQSRVDNNIFLPGFKWAEANEDDFKKRVNKFYTSPSMPQQWAKELQHEIKNKFSFEAVCKEYDAALGNIL